MPDFNDAKKVADALPDTGKSWDQRRSTQTDAAGANLSQVATGADLHQEIERLAGSIKEHDEAIVDELVALIRRVGDRQLPLPPALAVRTPPRRAPSQWRAASTLTQVPDRARPTSHQKDQD